MESCGWHLIFCLIWNTAASTVGSTFFVQGSDFGLAAMAEVVVERPETIFIGIANRFAKGVEHVWRYKLVFVGAECIYVCMEPPSTTHAGDLMFILEEVVEGNKWYARGGLFQMRRASKSWRSALQSFVLRPRFGRMECTNGRQMMCGAGPPTQKRWKNRGGRRHAMMRCSCGTTARIASLGLNCFLAGRSDTFGVCVCVCNYRRFASLDLIAFWRGGLMHWGRCHLIGTKLSWILLLLGGMR